MSGRYFVSKFSRLRAQPKVPGDSKFEQNNPLIRDSASISFGVEGNILIIISCGSAWKGSMRACQALHFKIFMPTTSMTRPCNNDVDVIFAIFDF